MLYLLIKFLVLLVVCRNCVLLCPMPLQPLTMSCQLVEKTSVWHFIKSCQNADKQSISIIIHIDCYFVTLCYFVKKFNDVAETDLLLLKPRCESS